MTTDMDDREIIDQVAAKLREKYPELSAAEVQSAVEQEFGQLAGRPVRDYLSVLTERAAKKRLKKAR